MRRGIALIAAVAAGAIAGGAARGQTRDQRGWFLDDARVPAKLAPRADQKPVIVAIVDDAVRITHRDLADLLWTNPLEIQGNRIDDDGNGHVDDVHGWDVSDDDADVGGPPSRNDLYHGTHLAGIVAGVVRAAYGDTASRVVRIMPVKALADTSRTTSITDGYAGISYAVAAGADIIICSWGVGQITPQESGILQDAADKGILVVASGGNLPEEREQFPAAHPTVLAVTSTDQRGRKVVNANFGQFIDIAAPGVAIRGASADSDEGYDVRDGTSQAAAITAAAAALIKVQHPSYSPAEVEACLLTSSTPIESPGREFTAKLGAGKLNVEAAVACPLLVDDAPPPNRLVHTKGFLKVRSMSAAPISWNIEPPGEFNGVRFRLAAGRGQRARGRLEFRAGRSPDARLVGSHPLDAFPASVYVAGGAAYVTFIPEGDPGGAFSLVQYEIAAIDFRTLYCRGTKEIREEGTLTDGSGPNDYSARTDCRWHIVAPPGKVIRFQIDDFDTEAKVDLLSFFNGGATLQEQLIAILSGPGTTPKELTTWGHEVLVWFVTDGRNQGRGWQMTYRFVDRAVAGYVSDPAGNALVDVAVVLSGIDVRENYTATTDGEGRYEFGGVIAGAYRIDVRHPGIAAVVQTLKVEAGEPLKSNIRTALTAEIELTLSAASVRVLRRWASGGPPPVAPIEWQCASKGRPCSAPTLISRAVTEHMTIALTAPGTSGAIVQVTGVIAADGFLKRLSVNSATSPELAAAALAELERTQWEPGRFRDVAVDTMVSVQIQVD